jgi:aminoglycoside 2'-N-acetyltransferase I
MAMGPNRTPVLPHDPLASCLHVREHLHMPHVISFREAETPDVLRRQVRAMQEQAWPSGDATAARSLAPVHDVALRPVSLLLVDGDSVLSALDVLFKQIEHAGRSFSAAGLSAVVTPSALRGQGYGRMLVSHAHRTMPELGPDLGLFTCDRPLQAFYEECGWQVLPGTVLVGGTPDEPFPSDLPGFDKVTLGSFFSSPAVEARESFLGARVLLYSGSIDRLW